MTGLVADRRDIDSKKLVDRDQKENMWKCIMIAKENKDMLGCSALGETEGFIIYND